ncbi:MAG: hypothetical protein RI953_561 [Pseudomonadota bacterium]
MDSSNSPDKISIGRCELGFLSGVLAPSIAVHLLAPSANLSGSAESASFLIPRLEATRTFETQALPFRPVAGRWTWNGVEFHESDFKIAYDSGSKSEEIIWYAGMIPNVDQISERMAFHESHALNSSQAKGLFAEHLRAGSWDLPQPEPVFRMTNESVESWWRLKFQNGKRVFWLREEDGRWGEEPAPVLHATATAVLYRENSVASAATGLEEIALNELLDASYLRNKFYRVLNCLGKRPSFLNCGNYARSLTGRYDYPPESKEYSEMVGYYSIQKAMEWHRGIQTDAQKNYFGDFGLKGPIDVFVRAEVQGGPSYAPFSQSLDSTNPVIYVSTGVEGRIPEPGELANTTKDSDVFFHEFSHHIIYRSIVPSTTYSQPRALQEGLADYFTYAITGNNLLGESIYGGTVPLRAGILNDALSADSFQPAESWDVYRAGELLSSIFWKLRGNLGDWKGNYKRIDKVVWDAIDLMPKLGTYYQFACAVLKQAASFEKSENLTAGTLTTPILQELAARQFFADANPGAGGGCPVVSAILQTVDQREAQKSELPLVDTPKTPVAFTGEAKNALPPFGGSLYQPLQPRKVRCGDLASQSSNRAGISWLLMLGLAPALVIAVRRERFFRSLLNWHRRGIHCAAAAKGNQAVPPAATLLRE